MKRMKKLLSMLVCLMMVIGMTMNAFAATTVSLTVKHIADGHTFTAYQIFDGDLTESSILSNVTWGTGVNDGAALLNALKADDVVIWNSDKTDSVVFKDVFLDATNAAKVADILKDWSNNGARLDHFAEVVGNGYLGAGTSSNVTVADNGDGTFSYTIEGLDPGYYLIKDTTTNVDGEDYSTKYMIYLTTTTTMETKGDYTTVEKTVSDILDGTYADHIAEQLNKEYYYKWEASLDDELEWFDTYKLQFTDTMSAGLTFEEFEEVYILEADNNKVYLYKDGAWIVDAVKGVNGTPTTESVTVGASGTTVVLGWDDLKTAYTAVAGDDKLVVKYSATLNTNAVFGVEGNPNEVYIDFSNSPSNDDEGTSVPDDANSFSFQLKVIKTDADNQEVKLAGAEFYLYHFHGSEKHYAVVDGAGKITGWVDDMNAATKLVTKADGTFGYNLQGLNDNTLYYLHEAKAPTGYNKLFTDVSISIHPNFVTKPDGTIIYDSLTYLVDGKDVILSSGDEFTYGIVTATVLNDSGTTLPSTGGMGTTLFYAFGGIMVVAAVVLLVTKKRMSADN